MPIKTSNCGSKTGFLTQKATKAIICPVFRFVYCFWHTLKINFGPCRHAVQNLGVMRSIHARMAYVLHAKSNQHSFAQKTSCSPLVKIIFDKLLEERIAIAYLCSPQPAVM